MSRSWTGETKRLFVACDLPHAAAVQVTRWQEAELRAHDELRVVESVHLTLCFLGDVRVERLPLITEALGAIPFSRFELDVAGALFLPERGAKRVIALELVDGTGALTALQADVVARPRRAWPPQAREAALPAPRDGRPLPPSRSTVFPAKRQRFAVWCGPDGPV